MSQLENMLKDLRRSQRWLETAGREHLLETLPDGSYDRKLTVSTVQHLHSLTQSFLKAAREEELLVTEKELAVSK